MVIRRGLAGIGFYLLAGSGNGLGLRIEDSTVFAVLHGDLGCCRFLHGCNIVKGYGLRRRVAVCIHSNEVFTVTRQGIAVDGGGSFNTVFLALGGSEGGTAQILAVCAPIVHRHIGGAKGRIIMEGDGSGVRDAVIIHGDVVNTITRQGISFKARNGSGCVNAVFRTFHSGEGGTAQVCTISALVVDIHIGLSRRPGRGGGIVIEDNGSGIRVAAFIHSDKVFAVSRQCIIADGSGSGNAVFRTFHGGKGVAAKVCAVGAQIGDADGGLG